MTAGQMDRDISEMNEYTFDQLRTISNKQLPSEPLFVTAEVYINMRLDDAFDMPPQHVCHRRAAFTDFWRAVGYAARHDPDKILRGRDGSWKLQMPSCYAEHQ